MSTRTLTFSGADLRTKALAVDDDKLVVDATTGKVGVGTTEPTESLDIVGNLNLQKVSNTATIKLNSNVVTEFARSKKSLIKYPRVAMTAATTEGYTASASTTFGDYSPYLAFDHNITDIAATTLWTSADSTYDSNDNYAYSSTASLGGVSGEWLKLELPVKIKPEYVRIFPRTYSPPVGNNQSPEDFVFLASNDDSTWVQLGSVTGWVTNATWGQWSIPSQTSYKYYAMVCTRTIGSTLVGLAEMEIYGVPEYDPEAHGTDVIMRSVPNVPNTDWLEVYWDAGNTSSYSGSGTTVTDLSGNERTGTLTNNVTFDIVHNGWITTSTTTSGITGSFSVSGGDWVHSVSYWVKVRALPPSSVDYLFGFATAAAYNSIAHYIKPDGTLVTGAWTLDYPTSDFTIPVGEWFHVTTTYQGGGFSPNVNAKTYINGELKHMGTNLSSGTDGTALGIPTSTQVVYLGYGYGGAATSPEATYGSFRMYNRALSADEVWQLYAYQKEYFDVSPDVVTFKGGRLGIGTSEPRAVLDVAGGIKINGGTILGTFEEYEDTDPWVVRPGSSSSVSCSPNGHIHYQKIGNFCKATFDYTTMYVVGNGYLNAEIPPGYSPRDDNSIETGGPFFYTRIVHNAFGQGMIYYDGSSNSTNGKKWNLVYDLNASEFPGGGGTQFTIYRSSIVYKIA